MAKISAPVRRALKHYGLKSDRVNWRKLAETLASDSFPPKRKRGRRVKWTKAKKRELYFVYCGMLWNDRFVERTKQLSKSAIALILSRNKWSPAFELSPARIRKLINEGDRVVNPEAFGK